jgi:outer membrane protein OmpA-like peptidoglycan-associated protein
MKNVTCILLLLFFINSTIFCAEERKYSNISNLHNYSDSSLILIPFEYKQSALYHAFTYEVIDSVVNMLLKNDSITLTIKGYAHQDEGSDTICKYLSLNRALFVRDYILGRGVKDSRIILVEGMGKARSLKSNVNKDGHALNCRAELILNYPPPPPPVVIADKDEDGIADSDDSCPDEYGYKENNGCGDMAIIIPFETQQSWLSPLTYIMLDSVVLLLKENPSFKLSVQGHAYKTEGTNSFCERLAAERAAIVKKYLLSRNIAENRVIAIKNFACRRPYNAGKNPKEISLNYRAQIVFEK